MSRSGSIGSSSSNEMLARSHVVATVEELDEAAVADKTIDAGFAAAAGERTGGGPWRRHARRRVGEGRGEPVAYEPPSVGRGPGAELREHARRSVPGAASEVVKAELGAGSGHRWGGAGGGDGRNDGGEAEVIENVGGNVGGSDEGEHGEGVAAARAGGDESGPNTRSSKAAQSSRCARMAAVGGRATTVAVSSTVPASSASRLGSTGTTRSRKRWAEENTPW
jgi:hypothetical protein